MTSTIFFGAIGLLDFLPAGDLILSGYLISGSGTLAAFAF
jgi:hypothetical protein